MNFFENIPNKCENEIIEVLQSNKNCRIERIISDGHSSEENFWYKQEQNEWVIVLEGSAELEFENQIVKNMKKGDYIFIPAEKKHRVKSTDSNKKTIWLAIFFE